MNHFCFNLKKSFLGFFVFIGLVSLNPTCSLFSFSLSQQADMEKKGASWGKSYAESEKGSFSFVVMGDSRTGMKIPYKQSETNKIQKALLDMFSIGFGQKVTLDYIQEKGKLTFDPITQELMLVEIPFISGTEVSYLLVDKGWITEGSVEDVKNFPGLRKIIFRLFGSEWVFRDGAREVNESGAEFILHTGDLVWWGFQGRTLQDSPYWQRLNELLLTKLPPPDQELKNFGLEGRFFPSLGNHDTFGDPKIEGLLSVAPYLKKLGLSPDKLIYKFDFQEARFIFLWTGPFDYRTPSKWDSTNPTYSAQMKQLKEWLEEAKKVGIKKVFISFHNPVFARSGFGGIPEPHNPHKLIASYSKDFEIVVFNGHIHTTELYDVDGVKYLILGGGGAEQDPNLPGRAHIKIPDNYPKDLYWKEGERREEYNYVIAEVVPGKKTKLTLKRFDPASARAFSNIELFAPKKS